MSGGDPLAGLTMPPGSPDGLGQAAGSFTNLASGVTTTASSQTSTTASVVGVSWISDDANRISQTVDGINSGAGIISQAATDGSSALKICANAWQDAISLWKAAQTLAQAALDDEATHNTPPAGGTPAGGTTPAAYTSPLRAQAHTMGQKAVEDATTAIRAAAGKLDSIITAVSESAPNLMTKGGAGGAMLAAFILPDPGGPPLTPADQLIQNGKRFVGPGGGRKANKFPTEGEEPNQTLYKTNAEGDVTSYAHYGPDGRIEYRVDITSNGIGRTHAGIEDQYVETKWDKAPDGTEHPRELKTVEAEPDQIPQGKYPPDLTPTPPPENTPPPSDPPPSDPPPSDPPPSDPGDGGDSGGGGGDSAPGC